MVYEWLLHKGHDMEFTAFATLAPVFETFLFVEILNLTVVYIASYHKLIDF